MDRVMRLTVRFKDQTEEQLSNLPDGNAMVEQIIEDLMNVTHLDEKTAIVTLETEYDE
jgi:hypothetical protein